MMCAGKAYILEPSHRDTLEVEVTVSNGVDELKKKKFTWKGLTLQHVLISDQKKKKERKKVVPGCSTLNFCLTAVQRCFVFFSDFFFFCRRLANQLHTWTSAGTLTVNQLTFTAPTPRR